MPWRAQTFKIIYKKSPLFLQEFVTIKNDSYNLRYMYINTADILRSRTTKYGNTLSGMRQQYYGIHCQVRSEICPQLTSLQIIFQIGVVREMFLQFL
jgi:hypothetical protein